MFEGDTDCQTDDLLYIDNLAKKLQAKDANLERVKDKGNEAVSDNWLTIGGIVLKNKDRQEVISGKELTDMQVNT